MFSGAMLVLGRVSKILPSVKFSGAMLVSGRVLGEGVDTIYAPLVSTNPTRRPKRPEVS